MTPTDEKFAQLDRIEQECFHGSWTPETLLSEINSPLNVLCTEESGGITAGFALERLHGEMKSRGAACCFLEVRSRNSAAIALYEKAGYEYISTRRNYYPDDDAAIYRIAL